MDVFEHQDPEEYIMDPDAAFGQKGSNDNGGHDSPKGTENRQYKERSAHDHITFLSIRQDEHDIHAVYLLFTYIKTLLSPFCCKKFRSKV